MINNISALTKIVCLTFMFLMLLASLCLASYEIFVGQAVNYMVIAVLTAGISYALHTLGIEQGFTLASLPLAGKV